VDRTALGIFKIAVAVVALALLWHERRRARASTAALKRQLDWAWVALAVVGVLGYYRFAPERVLSKYSAYDLVHYYLNAKYFPELGYTRLYQACLVADQEGRGWLRRVNSMRDLYDQKIENERYVREVRDDPERVKRHFSARRWRTFKYDIRVLNRQLRVDIWRRIMIDRGYNATPTWHALGHALTSRVPATHLKLLCHLDTLLIAAMFLAIGWCHGRRIALVALVWFCVSFSTEWPGVGWSLLRYDWLAASVAGACLLGRGHRFWGGALIGWATLSRIFPAIVLLFLVVRGAHRLIAERRLDRDALRIAAGFLLVVSTGTLATWGTLGSGHFRDFAHDLDVQLAPENLSVNRMGLAVALAYRGETTERQLVRRERYLATGRVSSVRTAIGLALLLLLATTTLWPRGSARPAREEADLAQLGFFGFALLLTASYYYWALRLLAVVLHARHWAPSRWDAIGLGTLFAIEIGSYGFELITDFRYGATATTSIAISLYAAAVCVVRFRGARRRGSARAA
jgi:hypothetical protein